jgi:hypothetical protein
MSLRRSKFSIGDEVVVTKDNKEKIGKIKLFTYNEIRDKYQYYIIDVGWCNEEQLKEINI